MKQQKILVNSNPQAFSNSYLAYDHSLSEIPHSHPSSMALYLSYNTVIRLSQKPKLEIFSKMTALFMPDPLISLKIVTLTQCRKRDEYESQDGEHQKRYSILK